MTNYALLEKAVEITKEYVRGGGNINPNIILEMVFRKLKELNKEIEE